MSRRPPISTYEDIIKLVPNLRNEDNIGPHKYVISPLDIRSRIVDNDSEIRGILRPLYGDNLQVTPYLASPTALKTNKGMGYLLPKSNQAELQLNGQPETSLVYKIKFLSNDNFEISTEYSGAQGSGDINTNFTSDDGFITIDTSLWVSGFEQGDTFFIRLYFYEELLILLSSLLTAINILHSVHAEQSPNASVAAESYQRRYDRLIRKLLDKELKLEAISGDSVNLDPIQVDYEINELGIDVTNYEEDEWPRSGGY